MEPTMDKKSNGALIGAVVVIIILVLGGVYLWQSNSLTDSDSEPIPVNTEQQSYLEEVNMASVIEADLNLLEEENNTPDSDVTADAEVTQ